MPMNLVSGGTQALGAAENKETFDQILLRRAKPKLVHNLFAVKTSIPARGGTSVEWRRVEQITATTSALTEGTISSETIPTVNKVTATVQQYGMFFRSTDLVELQSYDPLIAEFTAALGEAMGDSLDQLTRNVVNAGTTVIYASTAGSRGAVGSGMHLSSTEIRKALGKLEGNNAYPINGVFPTIIHTNVKYDLLAKAA